MTRDLNAAKTDVLTELKNRGLGTMPDALKPLEQIDFTKLVVIHDHEERFLFTTFVSSLEAVYRTRLKTGAGAPTIDANDVQAALIELGKAVTKASEPVFSKHNKPLIREVCPWC